MIPLPCGMRSIRSAREFLSKISINDVYKWPPDGPRTWRCRAETDWSRVTLAVRDDEITFRALASPAWRHFQRSRVSFSVDIRVNEVFILQVAGPK